MNRIEARSVRSKFLAEPHLSVIVDGVPLDVALGTRAEGLVSALLGWFHRAEDCEVPWARILPESGCTGYAPILICPDDLDLVCDVVVVEVVAESDVIRWDKIGFDASPVGAVGSIVRWDPAWGMYRFRREEYEACLAVFRSAAAA